MILNTQTMSGSQIYHATVHTLLPRPIAWVLSQHDEGHLNLAPFSYFTAVSSDPPLLVFSVGDKAPGEGKDTKVNVADNPHFVIHIPSYRHAHAVTESSRALPGTESELSHVKLSTADFGDFPLPRLRDCAVAYGCRLHDIQPVKGAPQSLVFGHVEQIYIADDCARMENERLRVDASKVDPLARLGGSEYGRLGDIFSVPRPR